MNNTTTTVIPTIRAKLDPVTGKWITTRSSISLKTTTGEDGSVSCRVERQANRGLAFPHNRGMKINEQGIAVRNPNARHLYRVQLHVGPNRWWTGAINADDPREAEIIASNENRFAVPTGRTEEVR